MVQQIGNIQQTSRSFIKKANQSTNEEFQKVLTQNVEKLETNVVDESIYSNLKHKYDIRCATFEELKEIAQELYGAGAITVKEVAILTFDYERATQYIKQAARGNTLSNFTMYETNADTSGRRDWIAEFEARVAKDKKYGNIIGNANKSKLINILKLLEQ